MGGAALHFGWVAEMKTGEGKTLVSTLPVYLNGADRQGRPPHHRQRLPGHVATPSGWARSTAGSGLDVGLVIPGDYDADAQAGRSTPATSPTARTTSSASTTSATTWRCRRPTRSSGATSTRIVDEVDSILIDEARTPLIISGRVSRRGEALLQVRQHRPRPQARRRLRGRRGEAHRRPHRGGHREGRAGARRREPLRRGVAEPRPPAPGRAARPRSSTSGTRTTSSSTAR